MWYETLPFLGIMFGAVFAANYVCAPVNYVKRNKHLHANRWTRNKIDQDWIIRDKRLYGNEYIFKGLESMEG